MRNAKKSKSHGPNAKHTKQLIECKISPTLILRTVSFEVKGF